MTPPSPEHPLRCPMCQHCKFLFPSTWRKCNFKDAIHTSAGSDAVLDELEKLMDKRTDEHQRIIKMIEGEGEFNTENWRIQHQRLYALDEVYEWIKELRQQKEREN